MPAALPCLDFTTTPADVTCTQDASATPPPQPNSVDLAAAILPQCLLFDPPAGNPRDYETNRIIDQLTQQHEREASRLRDEHHSQQQALRRHHDAPLQMRDNAYDATLRDLRTRVNGLKFSSRICALRTSDCNARPLPLSCRTFLW